MRTVTISASSTYDVLIGPGLLDRAGELIARVVRPCRCVIVTDSTVDALYGPRAQRSLEAAGFEASRFAFPAGEASKNIGTLSDILECLADRGISRGDLVAALGGGVTGDIAGFAAAVMNRGMRFVQLPTTLLAAVDSSVGGKTAIDLRAGKNLAGAFHQPSLVVTDTDLLTTLPPEQLACGAAEAIKMGVLFDEAMFEALAQGQWAARTDEIIERCVALKRDVVARDEFDTGARALLNLGHTFGHAIEKCSGFAITHGQGVAIGTLMAAAAANCSEGLILRLAECFRRNGLSTHCPYDAPSLARAALSDKKRQGDQITLILPRAIGRCELEKTPVSRLPDIFAHALDVQEALGL